MEREAHIAVVMRRVTYKSILQILTSQSLCLLFDDEWATRVYGYSLCVIVSSLVRVAKENITVGVTQRDRIA